MKNLHSVGPLGLLSPATASIFGKDGNKDCVPAALEGARLEDVAPGC